jgi:hypothetical protein
VTDINTQMLVGMDITIPIGSLYRFDVIGTDDFGQPGRSMYVAYTLGYQQTSGQLRPTSEQAPRWGIARPTCTCTMFLVGS